VMLLVTIPQVMFFSQGMKIFDMMPGGYDLQYVIDFLHQLGPDGRRAYLLRQIPADMLYPMLAAIAYYLLMLWLFGKLALNGKPWMYLCLVPLAAGLFDYLENFGVILMITGYPFLPAWQVGVTSAITIVKSVFYTVSYVTLIIGFVVWIVRLVIKARKKHDPLEI
jgi:hypothetical protein